MNNKIIEVLKELGFEEREIKIYLALIKNSNQTALQISKQTNIDRTTTYDLLEKLIQKGIISSNIINNSNHFKAISPKQLLIYFKEKYSSLENILPQLNAIKQESNEPINCELFTGLSGLKTILKDLINSKKDYKVIGIKKEYEDILSYFNDQGIIKISEFKIKEIAIVNPNEKFKKAKHGVYRYLEKKLNQPITTILYDNKVVFFFWKEPYYAIRIEDKDFVKMQEEYFDLLWKIAKK